MKSTHLHKFTNRLLYSFKFLLGMYSSAETHKQKIIRYTIYFLIVLIANILLGKNLGHRRYPWYANVSVFLMLNVNIILILAIFIVLFRNIMKLMADRRHNVFGVRLQTKLVLFSVVLVVVPVCVTYSISNKIISDTIGRWTDSSINYTISKAVELFGNYQEEMKAGLMKQTIAMAEVMGLTATLDRTNSEVFSSRTYNYVNRHFLDGFALYSGHDLLYAQQADNVSFSFVYIDNLNTVLEGNTICRPVYQEDNPFFWCGSPVYSNAGEHRPVGAVFTVRKITPAMVNLSEEIVNNDSLFRQLDYYSFPVLKSFRISSIMIATLVVFACIWGSIIFVRSITEPLKELAGAAMLISEGRQNVQVRVTGKDEITQVSTAFNEMSERLTHHTEELEGKNQDLSNALSQISHDKKYIDVIYRNVDSGLVLFDKQLNMLKANSQAEPLLYGENPLMDIKNLKLDEFINSAEHEKVLHITVNDKGENKFFTANINKIFDATGDFENVILVIDDNTHLINLQRITLWKEVATRITHEIKNPLTPIKLTAERVRKRATEIKNMPVKEFIDKGMQTIISETADLLSLVDEFNQYARLPSMIRTKVQIQELVDNVVSFVARPDISFQIDIPKDYIINGDSNQLKRVFMNLFQNAIQAFGKEGGEIKVQALKDHEDALSITVEDNGPGIKEEDASKIFIPYFSKKPDGTGLGLAIIKKIIEEHGGSVTFESKPGDYTRFHIHLPYIQHGESL